jgi:hypothetical protein
LGIGLIAASGLVYNTANANSGCALTPLDYPSVQNVTLFYDNGEIKVVPVAEADLAEVERQYAMGGLLDHGQMFPIFIPDAAQ